MIEYLECGRGSRGLSIVGCCGELESCRIQDGIYSSRRRLTPFNSEAIKTAEDWSRLFMAVRIRSPGIWKTSALLTPKQPLMFGVDEITDPLYPDHLFVI